METEACSIPRARVTVASHGRKWLVLLIGNDLVIHTRDRSRWITVAVGRWCDDTNAAFVDERFLDGDDDEQERLLVRIDEAIADALSPRSANDEFVGRFLAFLESLPKP